jgi:hypothetical protein
VQIGFAALPLATAAIAGGLAARTGGSAVRRFTPAKPLWALGLLAFAAGAAAEAYGAAGGWGSASFKAYYLAGGCLTVALLGAGSAFLALPRTVAYVVLGAVATAVAGSAVSVLLAPVDAARLAAAAADAPPANDALGGHSFLWAIAMSSGGSALLIAASVLSLARRQRVRANVLILAGVLLVGGSGVLTRLGSYGAVYGGQIAGLLLLTAGFELAERRGGALRTRPRGLGVSGTRA